VLGQSWTSALASALLSLEFIEHIDKQDINFSKLTRFAETMFDGRAGMTRHDTLID